ncbi:MULTISPECIES: MATE family efflux transporter [Undibacterium]|uniref:Multidrug-efflux transporter n=1 Tax=Undibacterium umbellatum TaxID=2762300 RepID=A0ABR6ZC96_9BURK|nr:MULTISPECIES: MATE family efflux transporter [Undibacterium]MBC3909378.1 MATE family efflux transporter [Undibacterium umbellatum]MDP1979944.1 MATE family efflux transporter [Undibacterium sp.]
MKTRIRTEAAILWTIAWPVLIGQLATVGMSVADVAMTGHLSADDLASVSLGANVWVIILVSVMGIMMAVNTMIAHEVGAENHQRVPHMVRQSLWLGLGVGLIGCLLLNISTLIFNYLQLDPAINAKASEFVHVISLGMPAFAMYRALYGYTTSLNQTKPVMMIALGGLLFNIVMNWLFIYGHLGFPKLGSTGCALATGSGLWLMLGAMIFWIRRAEAYRETFPFHQYEGPNWAEIRSTLRLGLPIGVTYFAEVSAFGAVGLLIARFGVIPVAANQIALNFSSLVFMVPLSLGIALTTRVGQTLGEGDAERARFISWTGYALSTSFAVISALGIMIFRDLVAAAYTSDPAVQAMASELLLYAAIFQLSDAAQVTASCAIRGYKVTRTPMLIHLMAFYGFALPIGCLLGLAPSWMPWHPEQAMEARGFWIGLVLGLTVAGIMLTGLLHKLSKGRIKQAGGLSNATA